MSIRIQYAYLKQQTWLYRRNYPKELQAVLGLAYKQSLKTGDARVAKARAAEVNAKYGEIITKAKAGGAMEKPEPVRIVAPAFAFHLWVGCGCSDARWMGARYGFGDRRRILRRNTLVQILCWH